MELTYEIVNNICFGCMISNWTLRVILKYAGTMTPMAPILLVVGGAKAELAQASTGSMRDQGHVQIIRHQCHVDYIM